MEEKKFKIANIIAVILVGSLLSEPSADFNTLFKFSSCCVFAYCTWHLIKKKEWEWVWLYGSVTLFLNSFIPPIKLSQGGDAWAAAYLVIICLVITRLILSKEIARKNKAKAEVEHETISQD